MKLNRMKIPDYKGKKARDYIEELARALLRNTNEVERVVNRNDDNAATKMWGTAKL